MFSTFSAKPKGLKSRNEERAAKRKKSYAKKLSAYRRSETFKIVEQRAAGRCEFDWVAGMRGRVVVRCDETTGLQHHHRRYSRFGGQELPEDMWVLCKQHHAFVERQDHPHRRNGR